MSTETCYHCGKAFKAEPDDRIVDTWICPECGEGLVRDGVISDSRHPDSEKRQDLKPHHQPRT